MTTKNSEFNVQEVYKCQFSFAFKLNIYSRLKIENGPTPFTNLDYKPISDQSNSWYRKNISPFLK